MASSILAGVSIRPIVHPSSRVSPRVKKGQPSRPDKQARGATCVAAPRGVYANITSRYALLFIRSQLF